MEPTAVPVSPRRSLRAAGFVALGAFLVMSPILIYLRDVRGVWGFLGNPMYSWMLLPLQIFLGLAGMDRAENRERFATLWIAAMVLFLSMIPALTYFGVVADGAPVAPPERSP